MRYRIDARFLCPNCDRPVTLVELKNPDKTPTPTALPMVACCEPCLKIYTVEQWRRIYGDTPPDRGQLVIQ